MLLVPLSHLGAESVGGVSGAIVQVVSINALKHIDEVLQQLALRNLYTGVGHGVGQGVEQTVG